MEKNPKILKMSKKDLLIRITKYLKFLERKGVIPRKMKSKMGKWSSKKELLGHVAFLLKRMDKNFIRRKGIQFAWGNFWYLAGILYATKTMSANEQAQF